MAWENRLVTAECELRFVCVCMCVLGGCRTLSKQTTAVWLQDEAGQWGIIELLFLCPDLTHNLLAYARLACDEWRRVDNILLDINKPLLTWSLQLDWATRGFEYAFDLTMKGVLEMLSEAAHCICSISEGSYNRSWVGESICTPGYRQWSSLACN